MRARAEFPLRPRATLRTLLAAALALSWCVSLARAQSEPYPEEFVPEEEVPDDTSSALTGTTSTNLPSSPSADARSWANAAALYATAPDLPHCNPGVLHPATKAGFLAAFNALRALHGLAPVRYNAAADQAAGEAALMMATNNALSHDPPPTWSCWTKAGAAAAGSSNLLGGVSSPYLPYEDDNAILAEWLIEGGGDEIGHRRWLLDPYLDQTAIGRVMAVRPGGVRVDSVVLKVFDFPARPSNRAGAQRAPAFVAWPQGEYPAQFFSPNARLSFSITQSDEVLTKVDFSQARVTISDGEKNLPIRDQLWDNEGFGLDNCLSWRVDGIVTGRTYSVTITGIRNAPQVQYGYNFTVLD